MIDNLDKLELLRGYVGAFLLCFDGMNNWKGYSFIIDLVRGVLI